MIFKFTGLRWAGCSTSKSGCAWAPHPAYKVLAKPQCPQRWLKVSTQDLPPFWGPGDLEGQEDKVVETESSLAQQPQ